VALLLYSLHFIALNFEAQRSLLKKAFVPFSIIRVESLDLSEASNLSLKLGLTVFHSPQNFLMGAQILLQSLIFKQNLLCLCESFLHILHLGTALFKLAVKPCCFIGEVCSGAEYVC
jgi:hypothetical protein